jgi:hypothetical protein
MLRGGHRGFGGARVYDDDFGPVRVASDPLPHDGMSNARIGADENEDVALFEISIGKWRGIETERFLVSNMGSGHALAGIAVAMQAAHTEFEEASEQSHFFGADLAGAEESDAVWSVLFLDGLHALAEFGHRPMPIDRPQLAGSVAQEGRGAAVGCTEWRERFPPFGTRHPEIDGVTGVGAEVHGLTISEMNLQAAPGGTKAANDGSGGVGGGFGWDLSQSEASGNGVQFSGKGSMPLPHVWADICEGELHAGAAGIRGGELAAKKV